jgi:DNA-binding MarR family transcriptional regulator
MLIMLTTKVLTDVVREWSEVFMSRSGRDFKRFMGDTGLSFSQINVLMRLYHGNKCGISEIGDQLGISNAAASQAIDRLVNLGMIERTENPDDRRAKQLVLTQQGHALIEKGFEARGKWISGITDALDTEQQTMIISALTLLTETVRNTED